MIIGNQRPRILATPDDIQSSIGQEAKDLAASCNLMLDDWQSWSLDNILSLNSKKKWAAFESCEIVGRQMGKGAIIEARELAGLFLIPYEIEILHTAHEYSTAIKHFYRLITDIEANPDLRKRCKWPPNYSHGQESICIKPDPTIIMGSNARYVRPGVAKIFEIIARTGSAGRGFTGDLVVYDEAMILDALKVGATIPTLTTRPNPQIIYMASAGVGVKSSRLGEVRRRALNGNEPKLFYAEWSINPHHEYCSPDCTEHDEVGTPESYAKANPALGIRTTLEYFEDERRAMPESEWLRERMGIGQYPALQDAWLVVPKTWFDLTEDKTENPPRVTSPIFAIEVAPDRSASAISVAGRRPDGSVGVQVVEYRDGTGWIVDRARALNERWKPGPWIIDKRAATGTVLIELERAGFEIETLQATDVATASGQLFDAFRDDTIRHYGQSAVKSALAAADKRQLSNTWAFDRLNPAVDQTPLMSFAFALWGYLRFGVDEDYDAAESVHFDVNEIKRLYHTGVYGPADINRLVEFGLISKKDQQVLSEAGIPA